MYNIEQEKRFLDSNIPIKEIDVEMIGLIDVLNFDLKLKTQFCCYGHSVNQEIYVIFDKEVDDKNIIKLAKYLCEHWGHFGEFNKWVRHCGNKDNLLFVNWKWKSGWFFSAEEDYIKKHNLNKFVEMLKVYSKLQ